MHRVAPRVLGVTCLDEKSFLFYTVIAGETSCFRIDFSSDGVNFKLYEPDAHIKNNSGREEVSNLSSFRVSKSGEEYFLTFLEKSNSHTYLKSARSRDLVNWETIGRLFPITQPSVLIPDFLYNEQHVLFFGGDDIRLAFSHDLKSWNVAKKSIIRLDSHHGKKIHHIAVSSKQTREGPLIIFVTKDIHEEHDHYCVWSALLDAEDPTKVLWQANRPTWTQPQEWIDKDIEPIGVIEANGNYISYWHCKGQGIYSVIHYPFEETVKAKAQLPQAFLLRAAKNPIIAPYAGNFWETKQVFNPAAVLHEKKVHLFYRAIGDHDTSVLGYAASKDGLYFDERFKKPAYIPRADFEHPQPGKKIKTSPFESGGGGYGGIEDPRITQIGDQFYLTYVAYDGRTPPRVALSSISEKDFSKRNWKKWKIPKLISPPGVVDKNACILPEKINGKYVIFHRIFPDILIDFVDDLDFDGKTKWLKGEFRIHPRRDFWDSRKVGIGPPPIKTKDGWLAIYQAVGNQDPGRYKIGAMLLDLNDPTKVLYRCNYPILEPVEPYENDGFKAGVVYPCGAVVVDDNLIVYYGGADMFCAAAVANLDEFLDQLKYDGSPHLDPVSTEYLHTIDA